MKTHTLKFKGYHGRPKKIAEIRDLNEAGQPKSDQDILDEAFLLIHAFCAERNFKIYYTRTWNHNGVTIFDVGSHTEFFHLTPAVSLYADTTSSERSEQNHRITYQPLAQRNIKTRTLEYYLQNSVQR